MKSTLPEAISVVKANPKGEPNTTTSDPVRPETRKVAVAVGSGFIKVFDGCHFYRLRSLVTTHIPVTGVGSSRQLRVFMRGTKDIEFAVGEGLESSTALQSLKDGLKAEWYAPLTLAVLGHVAPASVALFNVALVCSIPTPNMAPQVTALRGIHDLTVNGRRLTVNVTAVKPVPEGAGTAYHLAQQQPVAVVDFGYQNTTIAGYDPANRAMIDAVSLKGGVGSLFEAIAERVNTTGERPSDEEIRLGVEAGTFELNGYSGVSFREAYLHVFEPWLKARIHDAKSKAGHIFGKCPVKVFAGGGSKLPGVATAAKAMGIELCQSPQEVEVRGIYRL